jgi:cytochrome c-type biogenesis protein CcmE
MLATDGLGSRAVAGAVMWGVLAFATASLLAALAVDDTRYYKMADEVGDLAKWRDKRLEIHGWVVAGTLVETDTSRTFALAKSGARIRIVDRGVRSDCLREGNEVVVRARIAHDREGDYVEATELMCKCSSVWRDDPARRSTALFY